MSRKYYPSGFKVEIIYHIRVRNSFGFSKSFTLTIFSWDSSYKNDLVSSGVDNMRMSPNHHITI